MGLRSDPCAAFRLDDLREPACRAAQLVFRAEGVRGHEPGDAWRRARDFHARCIRAMPTQLPADPPEIAARHAWAQCYAREYLASAGAPAPSRACEEAADIARAWVRRLLGP